MPKQSVLLFSVISSLSISSQALNWKVVGACSAQPIYEGVSEISSGQSVLQVSLGIFDAQEISYIVKNNYFTSILQSPHDQSAIEKISEDVSRVYHWCYQINGEVQYEAPSLVTLQNQTDSLLWFYAYSDATEFSVLASCEPVFKLNSSRFCEDK